MEGINRRRVGTQQQQSDDLIQEVVAYFFPFDARGVTGDGIQGRPAGVLDPRCSAAARALRLTLCAAD